jgi:hypothetical protein
VEGDEVNAFVAASNDLRLCSLRTSCTVNPGIFRAKKLGKMGFSLVFKNVSQELSLTKMTPFGPRGLTQWRTHLHC